MTLQAERLRTLRLVYGERNDARGRKDLTYILYVLTLLVAIVLIPVARATVVGLTQPEMISVLRSPGAEAAAGAVSALLLGGMAWLGRLRGPVTLQPFFVTLLASTDLPQSLTLRRAFGKSALLVTVIIGLIGALFAASLLIAGSASAQSATIFVIGAACFGFISSVLWLTGQSAKPRDLWLFTMAMATGGLFLWCIPSAAPVLPWGWVALLWPNSTTPDMWPLVGLVVMTVLAAWWVPRLLDRLDGPDLLEGADRWQSATGAAAAGDIAHAAALFRAAPTVGHGWNAVAGRTSAVRFLRSDLVATLRTPNRFAAAALCLLAAWTMVGLSFTSESLAGWTLATVGAVTGYLALGVFSDGFRHSAETAAAPPLYGYRTRRLYALHSLLPLVVSGITAAVGTASAVLAGASSSVFGAALLAPLLVLIRAYDSAKGPLPVSILTPVPTPAGDMAGLSILAWQADSLLIATISGTSLLVLISRGQTLSAVLVLCVVGVILTLLVRRRLRHQ